MVSNGKVMILSNWLRVLLALCALPFAAPLRAADDFYLKNGDTVVFYGDSITDQRLYTTFVETYAVTRFPELRVRFVHSGWGGDRVGGGGGGPVDLRLRRDVIAYRPTVMTIMLGMNDGHYRAYDQPLFDEYAAGSRAIVANVRAALPGIRITEIEPSPYDDVTRKPMFEGGYNAVLLRYGQFLKEMAAKDRLDVADLNTPVTAMLAKAETANPTLAPKILPDRVHPGPAGHLIMAEALLKAWGAPARVTGVTIDAASHAAVETENAEVSHVDSSNGLSWSETDKALPMPIDWKDEAVALAIHSSDFLDSLDQEQLRVTGLAGGTYTLKIDGEAVGDFPSAQLDKGINLAEYPTPMAKQAAEVHSLTIKHNNVHFARWRTVQVPLDGQGFDTAASERALDELEDQLVMAQRVAAQPKPHLYALTPAAK